MKNKHFLDHLGEIDPKYIEEADPEKPAPKRARILPLAFRAATVAAAAVLAVTTAILLPRMMTAADAGRNGTKTPDADLVEATEQGSKTENTEVQTEPEKTADGEKTTGGTETQPETQPKTPETEKEPETKPPETEPEKTLDERKERQFYWLKWNVFDLHPCSFSFEEGENKKTVIGKGGCYGYSISDPDYSLVLEADGFGGVPNFLPAASEPTFRVTANRDFLLHFESWIDGATTGPVYLYHADNVKEVLRFSSGDEGLAELCDYVKTRPGIYFVTMDLSVNSLRIDGGIISGQFLSGFRLIVAEDAPAPEEKCPYVFSFGADNKTIYVNMDGAAGLWYETIQDTETGEVVKRDGTGIPQGLFDTDPPTIRVTAGKKFILTFENAAAGTATGKVCLWNVGDIYPSFSFAAGNEGLAELCEYARMNPGTYYVTVEIIEDHLVSGTKIIDGIRTAGICLMVEGDPLSELEPDME